MSVFTDSAARRYARLALDAEHGPGFEPSFISAPPRPLEEEARALVDEWFADVYGWPLTPRESAQRDDFLARVLHYASEGR